MSVLCGEMTVARCTDDGGADGAMIVRASGIARSAAGCVGVVAAGWR